MNDGRFKFPEARLPNTEHNKEYERGYAVGRASRDAEVAQWRTFSEAWRLDRDDKHRRAQKAEARAEAAEARVAELDGANILNRIALKNALARAEAAEARVAELEKTVKV